MSYEDIKQEILDNWKNKDGRIEEWLDEAVDSALRTYHSDIIEQWRRMPSEYRDNWQEFVVAIENHTLTGLMAIDLYLYLSDQYREAYAEIQEAKKQAND
jgi:hypothetical protein